MRRSTPDLRRLGRAVLAVALANAAAEAEAQADSEQLPEAGVTPKSAIHKEVPDDPDA